jgi:hypothetical protein
MAVFPKLIDQGPASKKADKKNQQDRYNKNKR